MEEIELINSMRFNPPMSWDPTVHHNDKVGRVNRLMYGMINLTSELGHAFENIKNVKDDRYDHIFVDLNDDQFCIDLASKNMDSLVRILKPNGVITAQVGSQDKKPEQVEKWLDVFNKNFGNTTLDRVYIPSFDCSWNFSSSINH